MGRAYPENTTQPYEGDMRPCESLALSEISRTENKNHVTESRVGYKTESNKLTRTTEDTRGHRTVETGGVGEGAMTRSSARWWEPRLGGELTVQDALVKLPSCIPGIWICY